MTQAEKKIREMDAVRLKYIENLDYTKTPEELISKVADFIEMDCWTLPMARYAMKTMYTALFKRLSEVA